MLPLLAHGKKSQSNNAVSLARARGKQLATQAMYLLLIYGIDLARFYPRQTKSEG